MQRVAAITFSVLLILSVGGVTAQETAEEESVQHKVAADLVQAAQIADIEVGIVTDDLQELALSQAKTVDIVYSTLPKDVRVDRLARYLNAKKSASGGSGLFYNVSDFHWGYIADDVAYVPARFAGTKTAELVSLESEVGWYDFSGEAENALWSADGVYLLPTRPQEKVEVITATFRVGRQIAVWTGSTLAEQVEVATTGTSEGCELFVNSEPAGATVYFNNKKWYRRTNTSAVQDIGTWEVVLELEGYKKWSAKRDLGPGESWMINAVLNER